jgi:surface protein
VDDGVDLNYAFDYTQCESTSCGVIVLIPDAQGITHSSCDGLITGYALDDTTIRTAVAAWLADATAAEATYGHISTWKTGGVTDMSLLFCACALYTAPASFNEDISAWDTSGVSDMSNMFYNAEAFNQDIGGWRVYRVTDMTQMFQGANSFNQDLGNWRIESVTDMSYIFAVAYSFNQDLGWCVDDSVGLHNAFYNTPCEPTYCGVWCPETKKKEQTPVAIIAGVAAGAALLLAVGAFCFYRRRKASMMDKADEPSGADPEPTELSAPEEATTPKEEEATIPVAPEGEEEGLTEQPPPPPRRWFSRAEPEPEAAAPKAEARMYNQIAAWYNAPENAALRQSWGAYPEPDEFQTWPGFVAVTNAFLDRETG